MAAKPRGEKLNSLSKGMKVPVGLSEKPDKPIEVEGDSLQGPVGGPSALDKEGTCSKEARGTWGE